MRSNRPFRLLAHDERGVVAEDEEVYDDWDAMLLAVALRVEGLRVSVTPWLGKALNAEAVRRIVEQLGTEGTGGGDASLQGWEHERA